MSTHATSLPGFGSQGQHVKSYTTLSNTTTETTILAAQAGIQLNLTSVVITNTSTTGTLVQLRDTTGGTVTESFWVPANDTRGITFSFPAVQTATNANWTAQCSVAVTDIRIGVRAIKVTQ